MLIKAALITALSLVMVQPAAACASRAQDAAHGQPSPLAAVDPLVTGALPAATPLPASASREVFLTPSYGVAGDIVGGHGPNPYARALTDIAIYASIGNKDGVAMLASQLRAQGVSRETIRGAINRINVHGEAFHPAPVLHRRDASQAEAGWEASQ